MQRDWTRMGPARARSVVRRRDRRLKSAARFLWLAFGEVAL